MLSFVCRLAFKAPLRLPTIFLICLFLLGCNQHETSLSGPQVKSNPQSIKIGLLPEQDIFTQKKRYEPLLALLSKKIGISIQICILPHYGNIIDDFNNLGLDGAFFGSFTGAMAIQKFFVEPLARPQYAGGASSYYGMVFVKKGSSIRTAEDMRGKQMVFVDRATTAGYLLPLAYFKALGIVDYKRWFKEYYFSGTHEDAIKDVLNGQADIGAAKNTVFYRMAATDSRLLSELEILETSPHVPANGLAVRHDLDPELKQALKQQLLVLHQGEEGRAVLDVLKIERFVETTADDYQPVLDYAKSIGLDLKTYNYLND
ncbi:MAG: phosphate/phosphite/phosphonate ABC transporter substrate-binding protein [Desulfuromonadales bacterium]|nr:phosphate/phosphite/phosphonate ABC transporter substrate-binding protein [Desulfuromonadales bacterium]